MDRPNPALTPGDYGTVRVARHVTFRTRWLIYGSYGIPLLKRVGYVIDHLVPLELCGTNDHTNLWPQPRAEARAKDFDEHQLLTEVLNQRINLDSAQQSILAKWGGLPVQGS